MEDLEIYDIKKQKLIVEKNCICTERRFDKLSILFQYNFETLWLTTKIKINFAH